MPSGTPIQNLKNLGPISAAWLEEAGVPTVEELHRLGPALTFRIIKQRQPAVSLNLLWGMAAGLADRDFRDLTTEEKAELRRQIEAD